MLNVTKQWLISTTNIQGHWELSIGTEVFIQEKNYRWNKQGTIVECLPYCQYRIKVNGSGRLTLQNRRFIRPFTNQQEQAREVDAPPRSRSVMTPTVINLDTVVSSESDVSPPGMATQESHFTSLRINFLTWSTITLLTASLISNVEDVNHKERLVVQR